MPRGAGPPLRSDGCTRAPAIRNAAGGSIIFNAVAAGTSGSATNSATTAMTIASTGNVGIGTTSPLVPLHVASSNSPDGILVEGSSTPSSPRIGFVDTYLGTDTTAPAWFVDNTKDNFRVFRQPTYNTAGTIYVQIGTTFASGTAAGIALVSATVGIGTKTMSSSNALEVNGAASIGYPDTYGGSAGGLTVSGNVGIGNTSPTGTLDVYGVNSFGNDALVVRNVNASSNAIRIKAGSGTGDWGIKMRNWGSDGDFGIVNNTTSTTPLYIGNTGNIAIGSTMSTAGGGAVYNLTLNGGANQTIGMSGYCNGAANGNGCNLAISAGAANVAGGSNYNGGSLTLSSGTSIGTGSSGINFNIYEAGSSGSGTNSATTAMVIAGTGDVGIGTTSPTTALTVNGVIMTNSASGRIMAVGTNSGLSSSIDTNTNNLPAGTLDLWSASGRHRDGVASKQSASGLATCEFNVNPSDALARRNV